ncbi:MAG: ChaN family lipoprotein [Bacteroidales bacterium]|nr:ChaN family lipoprotein [Bacteroidales bacterium]
MKIIITISIIACVLILQSFNDTKPAYKLFDKNGKETNYSEMLKMAKDADIVFFGELHNNPISHWLQYELTKDLHKEKEGKIILGAEMFESDNQLIMNEYLKGTIAESKFEDEARLWPNYSTDYKPLVSFAKENNLAFIATNIPRRYASVVFNKGFEGLESLDDEAKRFIAPLPVDYDENLDCYKNMMKMGGMGKGMGKTNENFPKSQAIKDATMAHFITKNHKENYISIHYNGSYHSDNYQGIVWYVKNKNKKLKIFTITTVTQAELDKLSDEYINMADFIIVVPETMTTTY